MQNPEFGYLYEDIKDYKEKKERDYISLVESERVAEKDREEKQNLARVNERLARMGKEPVAKVDDLAEEVEESLEELDPFLDEAANITYDMLNTGKYAINHK